MPRFPGRWRRLHRFCCRRHRPESPGTTVVGDRGNLNDMQALRFDNRFVRELPADPARRPAAAAGARRALLARRAHAGRRAAADRPFAARWRRCSASTQPTSPRPRSRRCSAATRCSTAWSPTRPTTAATSSATGPGSSATAARSRWARSSTRRASAGSCSSRARARRRTRAPPTAAPCCARRCASSCAARRCITSACRRRARCAWWRPASRSCATCSTTAIPRPSRARSCAGWRRRSSASATSSCPPRAATCRCSTQLVDFTIRRDFPELQPGTARSSCARSGSAQVCERTARMIAHWMRVGFVHGVMNTDNMSILGLTIDYGPYGWIDDFDLDWTPNTTDARAAPLPLRPAAADRVLEPRRSSPTRWCRPSPRPSRCTPGCSATSTRYVAAERANIAAKLGLAECLDEDAELMQALYALLQEAEVDMTLFFRALADVDLDAPTLAPLAHAFYDEAKRQRAEPAFDDWLARYAARVRRDALPPARAPRAHARRQSALRAAQLPRAAGDRPRRAGRRCRHPRAARRVCAGPTTTSPAASASPNAAPTGRATAPGARCCRAAAERHGGSAAVAVNRQACLRSKSIFRRRCDAGLPARAGQLQLIRVPALPRESAARRQALRSPYMRRCRLHHSQALIYSRNRRRLHWTN